MKFISTRDFSKTPQKVDFSTAILNCMPSDGGLYVPFGTYDLRRWILYANENTTFANLSGTLTLALINEEFSPIICEAIATKAFNFAPTIKQLDHNLFLMELWHTPTGSHKDFGIFYLVNAVETLMQMKQSHAIFLDASNGELGASLAKAIKGKSRVKAVILYPKGQMRGLTENDIFHNGGNILACEVEGDMKACHEIIRNIYQDRDFITLHGVTVANTANIGRLLPQSFFYTFAFSRLKKTVAGDIYYALPAGNYSNVVAGLYGWRLCLPVSGFIIPSTKELTVDARGFCTLMDRIIPLNKRPPSDSADPCNLERLEDVFKANSLLLKNFVYPSKVTIKDEEESCKELFTKYGLYASKDMARAYKAAKAHFKFTENDGGAVTLISRDMPSLDKDFLQHNLGEVPALEENVSDSYEKFTSPHIIKLDISDIKIATLRVRQIIADCN